MTTTPIINHCHFFHVSYKFSKKSKNDLDNYHVTSTSPVIKQKINDFNCFS